ncbi:MFS transporter [Streptomyces sp. NPDC048191]|uniref:MFS transporter n=1 Tax=Streptomyces sp. NPDC048191 TaxID=3155484 RepID=UPI0033D0455F
MTRTTGTTPIFMTFFAMGFADALGPFVSLAGHQFHLSIVVAQLIPFTGYAMFGLFSIPAGVLQARTSRKRVLSLGLISMLLAMLIPVTVGMPSLPIFLATALLMGIGATLLQVSSAPLLQDASPPGKFTQRLLSAQCLHCVGALSGPLIPAIAALALGADWGIVFPLYAAGVAITLIAVRIGVPRRARPAPASAAPDRCTFSSVPRLLKKRPVAIGAAALVAYMGAEITVGSQIPLFLHASFGYDNTRIGLLGTAVFVLALACGRLTGSFLLIRMHRSTLLRLSCVTATLGFAIVFVPLTPVVAAGFILIGLGCANVFPVVLAITLDKTSPQETDAVSSILTMTIGAGAAIPLLAGFLADEAHTVRDALLLPLVTFVGLTVLAFRTERDRRGEPSRRRPHAGCATDAAVMGGTPQPRIADRR